MARRRQGELVANEERVVAAVLGWFNLQRRSHDDTGPPRFWAKDVQSELARIEPDSNLNDSTVNRALKRLTNLGWLAGSWETADPDDPMSSRPRLYFRVTESGLTAIRRVVADRRRAVPLWVLYPTEAIGEQIDDDRLPLVTRVSRRKSPPGERRPGSSGYRDRRRLH